MRRLGFATSYLLIWFSSLVACTQSESKEVAAPCGDLPVETFGCAWVQGACELSESRELRVWFPASETARLSFDGGARAVTATRAFDGYRAIVHIPKERSELSIESREGAQCRKVQLRLPAAPVIAPVISEADTMRRQGEGEAAEKRLSAELSALSPRDRGRALGLLARIARSAGRADEAVSRFREAIAAHRANGHEDLEARDRIVLAYTLITQLRRFGEARELLSDPLFERLPDADIQVTASLYRARLFAATGDSRSALYWSGDSQARALRMGLLHLWRDAKQLEGITLLDVGRSVEATELYEEVLRQTPADEDACMRGTLLLNLGWARLVGREERAANAASPEAPLREALELWRSPCPEPEWSLFAQINLALAAVQEGRHEEAHKLLRELTAEKVELNPELMLLRLEIEGRIAHASGRHRAALDSYKKLGELAERTASPSAQWRAQVGQAKALELGGKLDAAIAAYGLAEAILESAAMRVPLGSGREYFFSVRADSSAKFIELLIRQKRPAEAAEVARRARVRPLATLQREQLLQGMSAEQRALWERAITEHAAARALLETEASESWRLPEDRLRTARKKLREQEAELERSLESALAALGEASSSHAPLRAAAEGELFLIYHPVARGYAGFAVTGERTRAEILELDSISPELLGKQLFEPFRAEISDARSIVLMPAGPLREHDLHALEFEGAPLFARTVVTYALDFPRTSTSAASPSGKTALIVADPEGNLSSAEAEANHTARALEARGFVVERLFGANATGEAVRRKLIDAHRFYYAGHARFGGLDGWESALPLAQQGKLSVADILALPRVPGQILLAGCETARSGLRAPGDSLGLAHAFLTAGAREVIATSRPIDDRQAAIFVAELAAAQAKLSPGADELFARTVREAQLRLREREPKLDWAAFRVLVP